MRSNKFMNHDEAIVLHGARQVGKTSVQSATSKTTHLDRENDDFSSI